MLYKKLTEAIRIANGKYYKDDLTYIINEIETNNKLIVKIEQLIDNKGYVERFGVDKIRKTVMDVWYRYHSLENDLLSVYHTLNMLSSKIKQ